MDLNNQTELELYFADHFDTVLFPVLADIYQSKGDYIRAKKVCEIGLGHNPDNVEGQYILAKAELALGDLVTAEKLMKRVLKAVPDHLSAALTLPVIQEQLERSESTLKISWKRALKVDPENKLARDFLKNRKLVSKNKKKATTKSEKAVPSTGPTQPVPDKNLEGINISPRLATFTLVSVLRNQGLFHQALDVLDVLEEQGKDRERINREREAIKAEIQP
ncbi:MAG: tetratricopeptide repeat protein [Fidelibacterota bacterium]